MHSPAITLHRQIFARLQTTVAANHLSSAPCDLKSKNAEEVEVERIAAEHVGASEDVLDCLTSALCRISKFRGSRKHVPAILSIDRCIVPKARCCPNPCATCHRGGRPCIHRGLRLVQRWQWWRPWRRGRLWRTAWLPMERGIDFGLRLLFAWKDEMEV